MFFTVRIGAFCGLSHELHPYHKWFSIFLFFFAFTVTALKEGYVIHRFRILRSHYSGTDADVENLQHSMSIPTQFC
jgi:hypothetical protein